MDVRLSHSTRVGDEEKNLILVGETRGLEECRVERVKMDKLDLKEKGAGGLTQMRERIVDGEGSHGAREKLGLEKEILDVRKWWNGRMRCS